jgi:hypothetical protein
MKTHRPRAGFLDEEEEEEEEPQSRSHLPVESADPARRIPSGHLRRLKDKGLLSLLARLRSRALARGAFPLSRRKGPRNRRPPVLCRANNGSSAHRDVLTVFPNTVLRFYAEGLSLSLSRSLSWIRLTCGICSASETSRRESREGDHARSLARSPSGRHRARIHSSCCLLDCCRSPSAYFFSHGGGD